MLYAELLVKKAEIVANKPPAAPLSYFKCDLEDRDGKKIHFSLMMGVSEGNKQKAQYEAVRPYFKEGRLLNCLIVYFDRGRSFNMAIAGFGCMQAYTLNWNKITPEEYFDPRRGYWVTTQLIGSWVDMPGPLELYGETNVPILDEERRPIRHLTGSYSYEEGLRWTRKRGFLRSLFG